jgi:hypothetical protein
MYEDVHSGVEGEEKEWIQGIKSRVAVPVAENELQASLLQLNLSIEDNNKSSQVLPPLSKADRYMYILIRLLL